MGHPISDQLTRYRTNTLELYIFQFYIHKLHFNSTSALTIWNTRQNSNNLEYAQINYAYYPIVNLTLDIETCHDIISQINGLELGQNNIILKSRWYDVFTEYITMGPKSLWNHPVTIYQDIFYIFKRLHCPWWISWNIKKSKFTKPLKMWFCFMLEEKISYSGIVLKHTFWKSTT